MRIKKKNSVKIKIKSNEIGLMIEHEQLVLPILIYYLRSYVLIKISIFTYYFSLNPSPIFIYFDLKKA